MQTTAALLGTLYASVRARTWQAVCSGGWRPWRWYTPQWPVLARLSRPQPPELPVATGLCARITMAILQGPKGHLGLKWPEDLDLTCSRTDSARFVLRPPCQLPSHRVFLHLLYLGAAFAVTGVALIRRHVEGFRAATLVACHLWGATSSRVDVHIIHHQAVCVRAACVVSSFISAVPGCSYLRILSWVPLPSQW